MLRVDRNEHPIRRLTLRRVGRRAVPVVQGEGPHQIKVHSAAPVELDRCAAPIQHPDGAELTVRDPMLTDGLTELHPVPHREAAILDLGQGHSPLAPRVEGQPPAVLKFD